MNLVTYNPFRELSRLERAFGWDRNSDDAPAVLDPATDIYETEKEVEVRVELPGLAREDVKVEVLNGALRISGEKKRGTKDAKARRVESYYGRFERSFTLGDRLNLDQVKAESKNGILTVTIGKKEEAKPKQIEVK